MENKITPNFQSKNRYLMILILAVYILYGFSWIKDSSFIVEGERYFCLADDMMVSMRYAKNLSNGYGLVWNQNDKEKVEGYSNFLWVLLMTVFNSLPFALSKISIFIQLSALLFLVLNLIIIGKITRIIFKDNDLIWLGTIILTAFYYPLNFWSFAGYEVSILTLLLNSSIYLTLKDKGIYKFNWLPALIMGISFLIRMEMIILFAVMIFFPIIIRKKKIGDFHLSALLLLIAFILFLTGLRYIYYGEILPNTYYLKMTGYPVILRISRGFLVFLKFLWPVNWIFFLSPLLFNLKRKNWQHHFLLAIIGVIVLYSIYIGGDAWEWWNINNRFITLIMPLVFIQFVGYGKILLDKLINIPIFKKAGSLSLFLLFILISLFTINLTGSLRTATDWLFFKHPFDEKSENLKKIEIGKFFKNISGENSKIALIWAGTIPYFLERHYIDLLGKNDKTIARMQMHEFNDLKDQFLYNNFLGNQFTFFYPGHLKWDYIHSIKDKKPDIIFLLWGEINSILDVLKREYNVIKHKGFTVFLLKNSTNIRYPLE